MGIVTGARPAHALPRRVGRPFGRRPDRHLVRFVALALALFVAGCQVPLYDSLPAKQGNQVLALLLDNGIDASKTTDKGGTVSISVDKADVAAAVDLLDRNGLPRDEFTNLGTVFQQKGLVSSPLVERVRYSYGLSQSIAETLTQIDGVLTARVHVVLPEAATTGQDAEAASAAVFIRYRAGAGIADDVPQIKQLVQNSIEGLSYEKISVAMFESAATPAARAEGPPLTDFLGVRVTSDSLPLLVGLLGALAAGLLGLGAALLLVLRRRSRADGAAAPAAGT
jgi:type III secretion protein J